MFVLTDVHINKCTKTYIKNKTFTQNLLWDFSLVFISNNPGKIEIIDTIKLSLIFL